MTTLTAEHQARVDRIRQAVNLPVNPYNLTLGQSFQHATRNLRYRYDGTQLKGPKAKTRSGKLYLVFTCERAIYTRKRDVLFPRIVSAEPDTLERNFPALRQYRKAEAI